MKGVDGAEEWPSWWRAVANVERLADGAESGAGALRRITWRTALPYTLSLSMRVTRVEPMTLIEGRAEGELAGPAAGPFVRNANRTHVRYDWMVEVTKQWMPALAPLLRPVFAWNHGNVMGWGYDGLTRTLAVR